MRNRCNQALFDFYHCPHVRINLGTGRFSIGSGITPPAPEMGCPPPSNIKERLTASRAPLGQNPPESDTGAPELPSAPDMKPAPANRVEVRKLRREVLKTNHPQLILGRRTLKPRTDPNPDEKWLLALRQI
jgi:hypothetical protein